MAVSLTALASARYKKTAYYEYTYMESLQNRKNMKPSFLGEGRSKDAIQGGVKI